jgi:hypothetical protein
MGKEVIELTPDQNKAFRKATRKATHTAFLSSYPDLQGVYGEVTTKAKSMR